VAVNVTVVGCRDVQRSLVCYVVTTVTGRVCCFHIHGRLIGSHIPERTLKMNYENPYYFSAPPKCCLPVPATPVWNPFHKATVVGYVGRHL
jgi:hypothetical protein